MSNQPSMAGQPKPHTSRNVVKKDVRTVLILIFVVVIAILLSLAVILSGRTAVTPVQTPSPTPTTGVTATGGNGELQLTLVLEKTVYSLGEPVNLTVTITNISKQTLNFTHTGLDFNFKVYNDSNSLVYQWSNFRVIPLFVTIEPFPAGESMSQSFTWLQTCNFNTSVVGDQVEAGTYYIVGQTGSAYGLQTTPIEIAIVKP
jgi:hypothetical protein